MDPSRYPPRMDRPARRGLIMESGSGGGRSDSASCVRGEFPARSLESRATLLLPLVGPGDPNGWILFLVNGDGNWMFSESPLF